jgi:hypothetical protein
MPHISPHSIQFNGSMPMHSDNHQHEDQHQSSRRCHQQAYIRSVPWSPRAHQGDHGINGFSGKEEQALFWCLAHGWVCFPWLGVVLMLMNSRCSRWSYIGGRNYYPTPELETARHERYMRHHSCISHTQEAALILTPIVRCMSVLRR